MDDESRGEKDIIKVKFMVDRTLGKLARKLRTLGFDGSYWEGGNLAEAAKAALTQDRVLLTRSCCQEGKGQGLKVLIIDANDPRSQVREVLSKLHLLPEKNKYFSICLLCNAELTEISKEEVENRVPDFIFQSYDLFHRCPRCNRIYWPGTHFQRMREEMGEWIEEG
jgi:uncharacterized protein with PIN domain